jgi:hypothetical protein
MRLYLHAVARTPTASALHLLAPPCPPEQLEAEGFFTVAARQQRSRRLEEDEASVLHSLHLIRRSEAELAATYGLQPRSTLGRVQVWRRCTAHVCTRGCVGVRPLDDGLGCQGQPVAACQPLPQPHN